MEKWLTVQEAAELSGYHPDYVRQLIRAGKVSAKKFSIVWMVDRASLQSYIRDQKETPQDPKEVVK